MTVASLPASAAMNFEYKGHQVNISSISSSESWLWKLFVDGVPIGDCDPPGVSKESRAVEIATGVAKRWIDDNP